MVIYNNGPIGARCDNRLSSTLLFGNRCMKLQGTYYFPTYEFRGEVIRARGARRRFNLGPCDVMRFVRGKHNRSSRQLGLRKSLILIVYHVSYEAHNYNSVGREICTKTVVCFDQSNLLSLRAGWEFARVVAVGTSRTRAVLKSWRHHAINPLRYFELCNRYTLTVGDYTDNGRQSNYMNWFKSQ